MKWSNLNIYIKSNLSYLEFMSVMFLVKNSGQKTCVYITCYSKPWVAHTIHPPIQDKGWKVAWNCNIHLLSRLSNLDTRPLAFQKGPNEPILAELEHFLTPLLPPGYLKVRCSVSDFQNKKQSLVTMVIFWNRQTHPSTPPNTSEFVTNRKTGPWVCRLGWAKSSHLPDLLNFHWVLGAKYVKVDPNLGSPKNIRLKHRNLGTCWGVGRSLVFTHCIGR